MEKCDMMENLVLDPDAVLSRLGKFGRYQMWIYFLSNIIVVEQAFQFMQMAFTNMAAPNSCVLADSKKSVFINSNFSSIQHYYKMSQCTVSTDDNTTIQCGTNGTQFVYDPEYGRTVVTEWDLVCDKVFLAQLPSSLFMAGGIFGSLSLSMLSDRIGRKWAFTVCCWFVAFFGTLTGLAPNYSSFLVLRILVGLVGSGMGMVSWVLCCEVVSVELRSFSTIFGGICWTGGYIVLGIIAYFIRDWRNLTLTVAVPFFITISFAWICPESLHWLVSQGKTKEAKKWIAKAAKINGVQLSLDDRSLYLDPLVAAKKNLEKRTVLDIFKSPILVCHTVILCYMWINNTLVYYGLSFFSTELSGNRYLNFIMSGLVEFPAMLGTPFLLNRIGRRKCTIICYVIAGISLIGLALFGSSVGPFVQNMLSLMGKFAITASFVCLFLLMAEVYPTKVRTAGCGFCCMVGRIGSILAPYSGTLSEISPALAPGLFGIMSLIAALMCSVLPETKGISLPEDINEVMPGPVFKYCFGHKWRRNQGNMTKEEESAQNEMFLR